MVVHLLESECFGTSTDLFRISIYGSLLIPKCLKPNYFQLYKGEMR